CQTPSCPITSVREEVLDAAIGRTLYGFALTGDQIDAVTREVMQWFSADGASQAENAVRLQLDHVAGRMNALTDALLDRLIDNETFASRKRQYVLEEARLREQLAELQIKGDHPQLLRKFLERQKSLVSM